MKKIITRVLTLGLACIMALSLTACGSNGSSSTANNTSSNAVAQSSSTEGGVASKNNDRESSKAPIPSNGKYASIEEYINSDILQSQMESLVDSMKDNGIQIEVKSEDNKLIYEYTYTTDIGDVDTVVSVLEQGLESNASTFETVASGLRLAVDIEDPVVVVRYLDKDGKELCSREFSAQ